MRDFIIRAGALVALALFASSAHAQGTGMTREEAMRLYAAGGFPISADGKAPTNKCGKAANPRITFVDVNGDGRKDALFIDSGPCYAPDGRWFSIATRDANGSWRGVAGATGTVQTVGTATRGWFDLNWTSQGKTVPLRYDGTRYATPGATAAAVPASPRAPTPAAKPPTGDAAIFAAAGLTRHGSQWRSDCEIPPDSAYSPGTIASRQDLNGDGRPEAVVTEGSAACYGMTGEHFWLVSQQADGSWKAIHDETGIAEFLKTKGVGGWPDISVGGPGFCFPVMRWNGSAYVRNRFEYEGKACRP